jgi:pimeloyl-ACP methyl ester carboxylesterase
VQPLLTLAATLLALPGAGAVSRGAEPEQVKVTTEDKRVLVADLYRPRSSQEAAPAALLVHDAGGQRGDLVEIASRLQRQGFAVLVPDLRAHGESALEESEAWNNLPEGERSKVWAVALKDLKACADFLREDKSVHASNLSLLGYRAGCALAARHSVRDENVRCVVLLGPQREQLGFDLRADIEGLGGLPTYIGVGQDDRSDAELLAESGRDANGGLDFVQIAIFKGVAPKPVEDKRMPADIAKWMMEQAAPKRGRER